MFFKNDQRDYIYFLTSFFIKSENIAISKFSLLNKLIEKSM